MWKKIALPMGLTILVSNAALADAGSSASAEQERVITTPVPPPPAPPPPKIVVGAKDNRSEALSPVTLLVEILAGRDRLWSGDLRVGPRGSANYSQSKSDFADPCPSSDAGMNGRAATRSDNLRLGINRYSSQGDPDVFSVNLNLTIPKAPCPGVGSDMLGIVRTVTISRGQQVVLEGPENVILRLKRAD